MPPTVLAATGSPADARARFGLIQHGQVAAVHRDRRTARAPPLELQLVPPGGCRSVRLDPLERERVRSATTGTERNRARTARRGLVTDVGVAQPELHRCALDLGTHRDG